MEVEVRLFATFREGRFKTAKQQLPDKFLVVDLLRQLGISPIEVGIFFINGRHAEFDQALQEGDVISLFPPVGGG